MIWVGHFFYAKLTKCQLLLVGISVEWNETTVSRINLNERRNYI